MTVFAAWWIKDSNLERCTQGWSSPSTCPGSSIAWGAADECAQESEHGLFDGDWVVDHWPMAAVIEDDDLGVREGLALCRHLYDDDIGFGSVSEFPGLG